MGKDVQYEVINGLFENKGTSNIRGDWHIDVTQLSDLVNQDLADEIQEEFHAKKDSTRFNAKAVLEQGYNNLQEPYKILYISLGDSHSSIYFVYNSRSDQYYRTFLPQDMFENIVQPFQKDLSMKPGDGVVRTMHRKK